MAPQDVSDPPCHRFCVFPLQNQERYAFVCQAQLRHYWLRMNLRPRVRFVNVNVKPNAIVIRVWYFGRPSASILRFVRVVSIIKGKSLDIGVLCRGELLQLRKIRFKLGDVTSYGLNSFPIILWSRFGWNCYDGHQKRAPCYHRLCAPSPQCMCKHFHACSATTQCYR